MSVVINGDTGISGVNGSAATPAIQGGDADTGIFFGTDTASISTGGSSRLVVDSAGRVGIGTAPSTKLHVAETGAFSAITASSNVATTGLASRVALGNSVGNARFTINMKGGGGEEAYLGSEGNFPLYFQTHGEERMRIFGSGGAIIGASSNIRGGSPLLELAQDSADAQLQITESSDSGDGPHLRLTRTRGGNLGSPTAVTVGNNLGRIRFDSWDSAAYRTGAEVVVKADQDWSATSCPSRMEFATTSVNGVSTVTRGVINAHGEYRIGHDRSDLVSTDPAHSYGNPALNTITTNLARLVMQERSGEWISFKDGGGTHYGTISRNSPGVNYGSNSDYRLKENIANLTNGIDLVKQLRPVTFNWNELSGFNTTVEERGFLAHEVQDVEPGAVTGNKDEMERYGDCYDAEGKKTQTNVHEYKADEGETWIFRGEDMRHQQLDPAKLVPILTSALQEAIGKIETLEQRLADAGIA